MELDALKKKPQRGETRDSGERVPKKSAKPEPAPVSVPRAKTATLQIHYNTLHYITLQNSIAAQHNSGDFTYTSVSDLIRSALQAYKDGMQLTELDAKGDKTQVRVRVGRDLKTFFDSFPNQLKSKITERAVRTFVKNEFR